MKNYEAYVHTNGEVMVKTVPQWCENIVDQSSPYVAKYLGIKMLPSLNQAKQYFKMKAKEEGGEQPKPKHITGALQIGPYTVKAHPDIPGNDKTNQIWITNGENEGMSISLDELWQEKF